MDPFFGKKILIAGLGKSGKAAMAYLTEKKASVFCFDDSEKMVSLEFALQGDFDYLVVSPGFPRTHAVYRASLEKNIPILGEMELGFRALNKKAVGVTGTNGKTTVVTNVERALLDNRIRAKAFGNIGIPLIEGAQQTDVDVFVIEISSFQLETIQTQKLASGCILNITPDHLDRYKSMEEYAITKGLMSKSVLQEGRLYVEENTLKTWRQWIDHPGVCSFGFSSSSSIAKIGNAIYRFGKKECTLSDEFIEKPLHDLENFLAAYALLRDMELEPEEIVHSFRQFKKLPHRIEFVQEIEGVSFFDDSKGTNIDAVLKAVSSMKGNVVLIVGGVDKGASYKVWIPYFEGKVKKIIAIGAAKEKIKEELFPQFHVELSENLQTATRYAFESANPGDNILLSPGCSSYDMFADYKHRGEEFKKIVSTL